MVKKFPLSVHGIKLFKKHNTLKNLASMVKSVHGVHCIKLKLKNNEIVLLLCPP